MYLVFLLPVHHASSKGESVGDTVKVVSCYADIIAMRHPKEGAPLRASVYSGVPIINAGDGGHNHPTQTLIDMMTIRQRKGRLDHLTVGFCGDLKLRTHRSLAREQPRQIPGQSVYFISPSELCVPEYLIEDTLKPAKVPITRLMTLRTLFPSSMSCICARTEGTFFQRGGLCPPKRNIHAHQGKA